jgi:hypothetical protein
LSFAGAPSAALGAPGPIDLLVFSAPWALLFADALLVLLLLEGAALLWLLRRGRHALGPGDVVWSLLAGVGLTAALRMAVMQAPLGAIVLCLAGAGLAHGMDLWRRLSRP